MPTSLQTRVISRLADLPAADWNALGCGGIPFLRHEFLSALEQFGCLGEGVGWLPRHLTFWQDNTLVAAMPMYEKLNSFGEFVFDWAWASAYQRAGLAYYPKLVVASPFTPATGPRLLLRPEPRQADLPQRCIEAALAFAASAGVSSCHWLFATDQSLLSSPHLLVRQGYQFHWQNRDYGDFEHYLSFMSSKRRKQIRKERREVREAGVTLRRVLGAEASDAEWAAFHRCYENTFDRHGNFPALTLEFFRALGRSMGEDVMLVLAEKSGRIVAAAFFLIGADSLYGRYWGAFEEVPSLHFEACYYQGLDYCLERGLSRFEPGAQGEHKISRGFLPTATWSLHWIPEPRFHHAIADFLSREAAQVRQYMAALSRHSPFKEAS
jgi:hypothetical protein